MKTLGEQYEQILEDIRMAQGSQSLQYADGKQINRGALFRLYHERDNLLEKINTYGRNYIEGLNSEPSSDTSLVEFK